LRCFSEEFSLGFYFADYAWHLYLLILSRKQSGQFVLLVLLLYAKLILAEVILEHFVALIKKIDPLNFLTMQSYAREQYYSV